MSDNRKLFLEETPLSGAFVVRQKPFQDDRGYFARAYCEEEFQSAGITETFVQMNMSGNVSKGTLRGLHYQSEAAPEAKLLRCIRGEIFDVIVDMRAGSDTYGKWFGVKLSADNRDAIYVPPLFAHGYLSLTDNTEVAYQTSAYYTPGTERGVRYNDPSVGIVWPTDVTDVSDKDAGWPDLDLGKG